MNDPRYKTKTWQKMRAQVIARDCFECQRCKQMGKVGPAEVVHHIKSADDFPNLFLSEPNLQTLCRVCHETIHGRLGGRKLSSRFPERW